MTYRPKSYRRFLATSATGSLVTSAINHREVNCVVCDKNISVDEATTGESLGEYYCQGCAEDKGYFK